MPLSALRSDTTPVPIFAFSLLLLQLIAFSFSFTPLRSSHDEWWHLKTGQYIAANGLPQYEIFTYSAGHLEWHNHEWITQLVMWGTYAWGEATALGGVRALILLKTLFIVAAFAGLALLLARQIRLHGFDPFWALLAGALCVALARRTFYPRPPFVTYLLLAGTLWLFTAWRSGQLRFRWLLVLPPIFALWANLHGGWMAGLLVVGAFWGEAVATLVLKWWLRINLQSAKRNAMRLTVLLATCVAGTLLNPYGYHLYALAGRVLGDAYLLSTIGEMLPPDWNFVWVLEGLILLFVAAAIRPRRMKGWLGTVVLLVVMHLALRYSPGPGVQTMLALPFVTLAIARLPMPGRLAHLMLVCFFMQQGLAHVRHLSLLGVIAMPSLAWALAVWAHEVRWTEASQSALRRPWVLGFIVLILLAAWWLFGGREGQPYLQRNMQLLSDRRGLASQVVVRRTLTDPASQVPPGIYEGEAYPVRMTDFLLRANLPGPLFNGGNYAGYLIWRFSPERHKVFTDNRYDIWGGLVIRQEHSVLNGWDQAQIAKLKARGVPLGEFDLAWNDVLDKWNVQTAIMPADAAGNQRLASAGWVRVYEDLGFNLWVRDTSANRPVIERALALPRPAPWLQQLRTLGR